MALEIVCSRRAIKDLAAMPAQERLRVAARLNAYAADPDAPGHDVIRLVGSPDFR